MRWFANDFQGWHINWLKLLENFKSHQPIVIHSKPYIIFYLTWYSTYPSSETSFFVLFSITAFSSPIVCCKWGNGIVIIILLIFSCDQAALRTLFSVSPSVCPSVCCHTFFYCVPIIVLSWNFQEWLPMTDVISVQKVKVRGQRSRSQRSKPILAVSGL